MVKSVKKKTFNNRALLGKDFGENFIIHLSFILL